MYDALSTVVDVKGTPTVYVVDDDLAFGEWITELLESIQLQVRYFSHPIAFLDNFDPEQFGCIILDVRLPEMSGTDVHKTLVRMGVQTPVLSITAYGDVSLAVEALKRGAVDFIQKPTSAQSLLDRIQQAVRIGWKRHQRSSFLSDIRFRLSTLSQREVETMELLLDGNSTKEIASAMQIGITTVDFHRHNLMDKMKVDSLVSLAQVVNQYRQLCAMAKG